MVSETERTTPCQGLDIPAEERLYRLDWRLHIQYGGTGPVPEEIEEYARNHGGQLPPYMPLPRQPVDFYFAGGARRVRWAGAGQLPEEVLSHVVEHGVLPRNTADEFVAPNTF